MKQNLQQVLNSIDKANIINGTDENIAVFFENIEYLTDYVVYHDAKIDVSTLFTDGQDAAILAIETAKKLETVAQFRLVNELRFEDLRYSPNQPLTLKEVSKVATQTTSGQVNLVRRIEIKQ